MAAAKPRAFLSTHLGDDGRIPSAKIRRRELFVDGRVVVVDFFEELVLFFFVFAVVVVLDLVRVETISLDLKWVR